MTGLSLELYAGNGSTLLTSALSLDLGSPARLLWEADRNGRVFVRARGMDGRIIGNDVAYQLIVSDFGQVYLPAIRR
jgi:hypothetical protein